MKNFKIYLQHDADKKSLLFVCLGNICRSPAAEAILKYKIEDNKRLAGRIEVDSAGIGSWHEGHG